MREVKKTNVCGDNYVESAYSTFVTLRAFLATLSYHNVGAEILSRELVTICRNSRWSCLDVGCGEGTFTATLLERLVQQGSSLPSYLLGVDPDARNLAEYCCRMRAIPTIEVRTEVDRIETFASEDAAWSVVLLSHSLYGYLENPRIADEERRQRLREIAGWVAPDGALLISVASSSSQAYDTKRKLLDQLRRKDLSRFAEDLMSMIRTIGFKFRMEVAHSYMDVTAIVNGEDRDLVSWISYFCRVPRRLLPSSKVQELRAIVRKSAVRFGDIAQELQKEYKAFPCDLGTPGDETLVLPHRECYIIAHTCSPGQEPH